MKSLAVGVVGFLWIGATVWGADQGPRCSLNQGSDAQGRPTRIPFAKDAREEGSKTTRNRSAILRQVADIPLPGRPARFDYQTQDPQSGRLYISHMNDGHIVVFDTRSRRIVGTVPETPRVTGVWVVPELKKLYASVAGRHYVDVIDIDRLRSRARLGPIGFPDGIGYAPGAKRILVSDESGGGELVIDGLTDKVVTTIPLGGEAGNTKYDSGSGCVLVAVQTLNQIVAIDPAAARIAGRYAPAGADHPHGMYVDASRRLLFIANQGSATLEVIDLRSLEVTAMVPVGEGPDVLAFDPEWGRLYVGTEGGGLWAYHLEGRVLVPDGKLDLAHAHTVAVDSSTHLIYLPLQSLNGRPVLRIMRARNPGP